MKPPGRYFSNLLSVPEVYSLLVRVCNLEHAKAKAPINMIGKRSSVSNVHKRICIFHKYLYICTFNQTYSTVSSLRKLSVKKYGKTYRSSHLGVAASEHSNFEIPSIEDNCRN